jgi:carotenoid phi-ring synthase / carotenoid chi-ring synthase
MVPVSRLVGRIAGMQPYLATAPASPHYAVTSHPRVVVAGGGLAGASIDHRFHGFCRQYYNWRRILARIISRPAPLLRPLGSYPVISRRWPDEELDRLPPAPPLSLLALTLRSPSLRLSELVRTDHTVGLSLAGFDAEQTYAHLEQVSAEQLLAALRLTERARVMLFNVFAHSSFNDATSMSAAELVAMFHFFFLADPEGLGMDVPHADYQNTIWAPLVRYLEQRGARIQTRTPVTAIDRDPDGHRQRRGQHHPHRVAYRTEPVWSVAPRGILASRWAAAMRRRTAPPACVR